MERQTFNPCSPVSSVVKQEIVRRGEGLFALADPLEERLAKARGQEEKPRPLPPAPGYGGTGLARAFAGQLVPHPPTDEPAKKLLKQIKAHQTKPRERSKYAKAN